MQMELEFFEEWRQVVGFEGYYEVSNFGRVRSLARIVPRELHWGKVHGIAKQSVSGGILRQRLDRDGYLRVTLKKEGKGKPYPVHSLMAVAFIGPRPPGMMVDHVDGKKLNNVIGNFEYVTPQESTARAIALGLFHRNPPGEKNTMAKLTNEQVIEIRRLSMEGMKQWEIGEQFGLHQSQVSRIVNHKRWKHQLEDQG